MRKQIATERARHSVTTRCGEWDCSPREYLRVLLAMASWIALLANVQVLLAMASWVARLANDECLTRRGELISSPRRAMTAGYELCENSHQKSQISSL